MKKSLIFGAGNIGRGFVGKILIDSGYEVIFVDIDERLIRELNAHGEYLVKIVGDNPKESIVRGVSGILSTDTERLLEIGCEVDLITTAVGPNILAKVAVSIAQIIEHRSSQGMEKSLNVIACENKVRASTFLKGKVEELLSPDALDFSRKNVGFADSAVDRIVPLKKSSSITDVHVEEFFEWVVDKTQLKEGFEVQDCKLTDKLLAFVERKLFTLNTGHATIAYMGAARGYNSIFRSLEDPEVLEFTKQVLKESGEILVKRHLFDPKEHEAYIEKVLNRFLNPHLDDACERVGREPKRKLGANDRFIALLRFAQSLGQPIAKDSALVKATGYAIIFGEKIKGFDKITTQAELLELIGLPEEFNSDWVGHILNQLTNIRN